MTKPGSYFHKLGSFLGIAKKSARVWYIGKSYTQFAIDGFIEKTTQPFLHDLIKEIKNPFKNSDHLTGLAAFDPVSFPKNVTELVEY